VAPWVIVPLLMLGGAYLAYEGAEKAYEVFFPHQAHEHEAHIRPLATSAAELEREKIASAIKTDFILSAEIMAITLAALPETGMWQRIFIMTLVAVGITMLVYGGVALIVKADDAGVILARNGSAGSAGAATRAVGRGLVRGMPVLLRVLSVVGTAAMIWVGGGILVHGLERYGCSTLAAAIHHAAESAAHALPWAGALVHWIVEAAGAGIVGLAAGALLIPVVGSVIGPAWVKLRGAALPPA
jgi:hypothetical protein